MTTPRWFLPGLFVSWAVFTAWLVSGFPPPVDLPAHGAQLETLASLVRGDADVSQYYFIHFPQGYGLDYWLFLPLTLLANGAVAARVDLWLALQLFVLGELALLRAFRRSDFALIWGLPLAFNISYWYGYVPDLHAQALSFFALACFARALETPERRWLILLNLAAAATFLTHLLVFAVLCGLCLGLALTRVPRVRSVLRLAMGLGLPALLAVPKAWSMATRAVTSGPWAPTEYAAASHFNWFFKNYIPEGWLAAWGPIVITAVLAVTWWRRRDREPRAPFVLLLVATAMYLATPKTLSGIYLISVRLPVLIGLMALLLVDASSVHKYLRCALVAGCVFSLVETALFHVRFKRAIDGLDAMLTPERPPHHGYASLAGPSILRGKNIYLEHLGQWLTATRGGTGHNFFADADHHPSRFKPGVDISPDLLHASVDQRRWFDEVLTFGEGSLPPEGFEDLRLISQSGRWRKWVRAR